jgi:hypothetical protein
MFLNERLQQGGRHFALLLRCLPAKHPTRSREW